MLWTWDIATSLASILNQNTLFFQCKNYPRPSKLIFFTLKNKKNVILFGWSNPFVWFTFTFFFEENNTKRSGHFILPTTPKGSSYTLLGPNFRMDKCLECYTYMKKSKVWKTTCAWQVSCATHGTFPLIYIKDKLILIDLPWFLFWLEYGYIQYTI